MNLEKLNLVELNAQEVKEVDGGFIPLMIFGTLYCAKTVAAFACGSFVVGAGLGVAVFSK